MMWWIVGFLMTFLTVSLYAQDMKPLKTTNAEEYEGSYWVMFSKEVMPGREFKVSVQILQGQQPVQVVICLMDNEGNATILEKVATVNPGSVQTIPIQIARDIKTPINNRRYGSYKVEVTGTSDTINFKVIGQAKYQSKSFSIFVQTDKASYKPSQKVRIRMLAINPDKTVINDQTWGLVVKDPNGNIIWQQLNISDPNGYGVIEEYLTLADKVPYGDWTIEVTILEMTEVKKFTVENYVLPKFEVELEHAPFALTTDKGITVTVRAKYAFGKQVKHARATLTISPYSMYSRNEKEDQRMRKSFLTLSGDFNENGEFIVFMTQRKLVEMLNDVRFYVLKSMAGQVIRIKAEVTETKTFKTLQAESSLRFYQSPVNVQFLGITPNVFKPGLKWTGYLKVRKHDDSLFSPEEAARLEIMFEVKYQATIPRNETKPVPGDGGDQDKLLVDNISGSNSSDIVPISFESSDRIRPPGGPFPNSQLVYKKLELENPVKTVGPDGWVVLDLNMPVHAVGVDISVYAVKYERFSRAYQYVRKAESPSDSFIQLHVPADWPKVGDDMPVMVSSTENISELHYQLYSKGMLVASNTVTALEPSMEHAFMIYLEQNMAPILRVVVFYIREDNKEFVADTVTLNVGGVFEKPVTLEFNKHTVTPGEDVTLTVKQDIMGDKSSLVYLLGVDKSVLLYKSGNDITQQQVKDEMMSYDYGSFYPWMRYRYICGWPSFVGGQDAASIFRNAGIEVLTDALIYKRNANYFNRYSQNYPMDVAEVTQNSGGSSDKGTVFLEAKRVRKYFPETWLWDISIITPDTKQVEFSLTAPDSITTWVTTVFTVHPVYGLTVGANAAELITFRALSVQLELPNDLTRYEEFCFTASVFNYHTAPLPVLLTLDKSDSFDTIYLKRDGKRVEQEVTSGYYSYLKGQVDVDDVDSSMFCFTPNKVGDVLVRVNALTTVEDLSDAVERKVTVKPEGTTRATSVSSLIPVGKSRTVKVTQLAQYVPDSQSITVHVVGNLLGPLLDGIDELLRKPYGCGEQNMINFAPNIFLLGFYFKSDSMTAAILQKGQEYMLIGYMKEMIYEHGKTGGYSTFGRDNETKEPPSLWLTAFITKCFAQAEQLNSYQEVLRIDMNLIKRSVNFMLAQQSKDGSYIEKGKVFNTHMQGGSSKGVALTAYTLIALDEALKTFPGNHTLRKLIRRSVNDADLFLMRELQSGNITDPYDLCIVAYAFNLYRSNGLAQAYGKMQAAAIVENTMKFWRRPRAVNKNNYWSFTEDAISIEATAYGLLATLLYTHDESEYLPIVRWLTTQRGPNGGFHSTQDTIIGLQALTALPKSMYKNEGLPYTVTVCYQDSNSTEQTTELTITEENQLVVQRVDIPFDTQYSESVIVNVTSDSEEEIESNVYSEVVMHYNVEGVVMDPFFYTNRTVDDLYNNEIVVLRIFIRTVKEFASMTIVEVDVPAGYKIHSNQEFLQDNPELSELELKGSKLVLYFNTDVISTEGITVTIVMTRDESSALLNAKPKYYKVYLYYEPDTEVTEAYNLAKHDFCSEVPQFSVCPYI